MTVAPLSVRERLIVALGVAFGLVFDGYTFGTRVDLLAALALMLYCFYLIIFRREELS